MKSAVSSAAVVALGLVLAVAGAANGAGQATTINLATTLNASQEVPAPTGDVAAARGTFTATVNAAATGATVAWELTFSPNGPCGRRAHSHRSTRHGRTGRRAALRPVPEPRERDGQRQCFRAGGPADRWCLRQRSYGNERTG